MRAHLTGTILPFWEKLADEACGRFYGYVDKNLRVKRDAEWMVKQSLARFLHTIVRAGNGTGSSMRTENSQTAHGGGIKIPLP